MPRAAAMKQTTFASLAFERKKNQTRQERFPGEMDMVVVFRGKSHTALSGCRREQGFDPDNSGSHHRGGLGVSKLPGPRGK
ncbi:hypothetical protein C8261_04835 [Pseudothauera lacus]|uniref:Uncharacterized protein n=1 Tax=Pseudothauera lacus TaxID=2136175 RepID=A0A2T4IHY8_9RHOO|nr:hypothetical protein C8261_04835 [Pseudothauera lacus]